MPAQSARKAGRPRASGLPAGFLNLQLSHTQGIPYRAGFRLGTVSPQLAATWDGDLSVISARLMPHERAELLEQGDTRFKAMVFVGLAAAALVSAAELAKQA